jgi:hypothetical protein
LQALQIHLFATLTPPKTTKSPSSLAHLLKPLVALNLLETTMKAVSLTTKEAWKKVRVIIKMM